MNLNLQSIAILERSASGYLRSQFLEIDGDKVRLRASDCCFVFSLETGMCLNYPDYYLSPYTVNELNKMDKERVEKQEKAESEPGEKIPPSAADPQQYYLRYGA